MQIKPEVRSMGILRFDLLNNRIVFLYMPLQVKRQLANAVLLKPCSTLGDCQIRAALLLLNGLLLG